MTVFGQLLESYAALDERSVSQQLYRWEDKYGGDFPHTEMVLNAIAALYQKGNRKVRDFLDDLADNDKDFDAMVKELSKDRDIRDVKDDIEDMAMA